MGAPRADGLCNNCLQPKEPTRQKSGRCRACDRGETPGVKTTEAGLCHGCGQPKEASRPRSRYCRACDGGNREKNEPVLRARPPLDVYQRFVAEAEATGKFPEQMLIDLIVARDIKLHGDPVSAPSDTRVPTFEDEPDLDAELQEAADWLTRTGTRAPGVPAHITDPQARKRWLVDWVNQQR